MKNPFARSQALHRIETRLKRHARGRKLAEQMAALTEDEIRHEIRLHDPEYFDAIDKDASIQLRDSNR